MTETAHGSEPFPTVAAIVVTYHTGPSLKDCLHALRSEPDVSEIVIVNNGLSDDAQAWVERFVSDRPAETKLINTGENLGFGTGVNRGAAATDADRLLIINPDAVVKQGAVAALEVARREGRSPCLVGGRLFHTDGREQRGARRELMTLPRAIITFAGLDRFGLHKLPGLSVFRPLHLEGTPLPDGPVPMPVVSGALMYISAQDFAAVQGFDEGYFLHVEDIDLCKRIADAGGEVIYTPHGAAMHYGSTSRASRVFVDWNKAKGLARYFRKNAKGPLEVAAVWLLLPVIAGLLMTRSFLINALVKR